MARGGVSFAGIGTQQATFKAGAALVSAVAANDRDYVVNMPVVITSADTVDLGISGAPVFGIVNVYETDKHVGVTFRGFVEGVPVVVDNGGSPYAGATVGSIVAVNGAGKAQDSDVDVSVALGIRAPIFVNVGDVTGSPATATATVFLG